MLLIVFTKIGLVFKQTVLGRGNSNFPTQKSIFKAPTCDFKGAKSVFYPRTVIFLPQGTLLYI